MWQYSSHVLPGLVKHRGPILTEDNWSGQWPGLVGMLDLNGSLTKADVRYASIWSADFTDDFAQSAIAQRLQTGTIVHDTSHARATGAGCISHVWFTIAADSPLHLKELVLRASWDGASVPSIESPVGDFFALNLGDYAIFESEFLTCSPGQPRNAYFAMPYRTGARLTVTNDGSRNVGAFYSNIDYYEVDALPPDALYFHALYRQATPNQKQQLADRRNLDRSTNYVCCAARGRGHLMGVSLGVILLAEAWMGEGDDMIFVDDPSRPAIVGTDSEDYFLTSWNFGGRMHALPFAHHQYGASLIQSPERVGGRYCLYRFHTDNPVTFTTYLKHTMERGHANDRGDPFYSRAYWYQDKPATASPSLPSLAERLPTSA